MVTDPGLTPKLSGKQFGASILHADECVAIIAVAEEEASTLQIASHEMVRILDRFEIVLPVGDEAARQRILDGFFDWLSRQYDGVIDLRRNTDNIQRLLHCIGARAGDVVLDYGCGTGLSAGAGEGLGIKIVGFDHSVAMSARAAERGLKTIAEEALFGPVESQFDGIIASYVLHLTRVPSSLVAAWGHLKQGGRFAANVHKGIGANDVVSSMKAIGAQIEVIIDGQHGTLIRCTKE